jgi:kynureninase
VRAALRERSVRLTGYLLDLLDQWPGLPLEVLTPRAPEQRGCQVSLRIPARPREVQRALQGAGVVVDFREPDVLRIAPTPLYNTFHEVWSFVRLLAQV